jgi:Domain of unknown function (DUF4345)
MRTARGFLILFGAFYLIFGAAGIWDPTRFAEGIDIGLTTSVAKMEMRSGMGIYVGLGMLFSYIGIKGRPVTFGLWTAILTLIGLLIGRLAGLYYDGVSSKISIYSGLFEIFTCITAVYVLYRFKNSHADPQRIRGN